MAFSLIRVNHVHIWTSVVAVANESILASNGDGAEHQVISSHAQGHGFNPSMTLLLVKNILVLEYILSLMIRIECWIPSIKLFKLSFCFTIFYISKCYFSLNL